MKNKLVGLKKEISLLILGLLLKVQVIAQDGLDVDMSVDKTTTIPSLFTSSKFWIGVGIVIIVVALIMGLSRSKSKS